MATLTFSDLKIGSLFVMEGDPWEVLEANRVMIGRGQGHLETKIRNLRTGNVLAKNFSKSDKFEEAEVLLEDAEFVYANKGNMTFKNPKNPEKRIEMDASVLGDKMGYLHEGMVIQLIRFEEKTIGIKLPVKVDLVVTEADPWSKGDTATGGTKQVTLATGLVVKAPPFIGEGDVLRINTSTGEYVERVSKAS